MHIECPHCHFEYNSDDIAHTLKNGHFKCPVCGKKFPSPLTEHKKNSSVSLFSKYFVPVFIILGIVVAFTAIHFLTSKEKTSPVTQAVAPAITPSGSSPSLAPAISPPAPSEPQTTPPTPQTPDKMKIVKIIAAMYHVSHSYTKEGGFVCLDMADDVWNQMKKYGIEAKIMGGNIQENITTWNYRQLALESNHAWVVAKLGPTEKVAIETTAGTVITPEMENASVYFKGIEFDNPDQIKRFERLRIKMNEVCRDANNLVKDWNENVAGKQHKSEETIAKQSRIEQREQDCKNTFKELEEFKSRAIFY
ncbi:MAG: hypothetical protein NTW65_08065 [Deltaproteobacteria bacterium]|nr:hypothetical protein [Deltaproteobacteria bacterium]